MIAKRFKRFLFVTATASGLFFIAQASVAEEKSPEQRKYQQCADLTKKNPQEALKLADRWVSEYPSFTSRHCLSLALFATGRYSIAERELKDIASTVTKDKPVLAAALFMQSADAAIADNREKDAISILTGALALVIDAPDNGQAVRDLVVKRSALYTQAGRLQSAIQDIEHAMSLSDDKSELYVSRARIYFALGMDKEASKDLKLALETKPENQTATAMLADIRKKNSGKNLQ